MSKVNLAKFAKLATMMWASVAISTLATLWWTDHISSSMTGYIGMAVAALPMFIAALIYSDIFVWEGFRLPDYVLIIFLLGVLSALPTAGASALNYVGFNPPKPFLIAMGAMVVMMVASISKHTLTDFQHEQVSTLQAQVEDLTYQLANTKYNLDIATGAGKKDGRPRIATIRRATPEEIQRSAAMEALIAPNTNPVGFVPPSHVAARPQTAPVPVMQSSMLAAGTQPTPVTAPPPMYYPTASATPAATAPVYRPPNPAAPSTALPTAPPMPPIPASLPPATPMPLRLSADELSALRRVELALDEDHRAGVRVLRRHNGREMKTAQLKVELAALRPDIGKEALRKVFFNLKELGLAGNDGSRQVYWARTIPGLWEPAK